MIYLDNAATSLPKAPGVADAVRNCLENLGANPGRGSYQAALASAEMVEDCREKMADLIGVANPLNLIFTHNATESLNLAIKGFLKPGDHVIISALEHNAVWRPLKKLEQQGVSLTVAPADEWGRIELANLSGCITPQTRLLVATHASNVTGVLNPVQALGQWTKDQGIRFLVDASQTAGCYPLNVARINADMVAFSGHKGLLGPAGVGVLYLNKDIRLETLLEGGTGSQSELPYMPEEPPGRYESGTLNTPGIAGLRAALTYLAAEGVENIHRHINTLSLQLRHGLRKISGARLMPLPRNASEGGVVSFVIPGLDCQAAAHVLDTEHGIACRAGLHCAPLAHQALGTLDTGTIRFSVGAFNTVADVEAALVAVKNLL